MKLWSRIPWTRRGERPPSAISHRPLRFCRYLQFLFPMIAISRLLLLIIVCGCPWLGANGSGFFASEDPVEFRLEAPLESLKKQRGDEVEWLEGRLIYSTGTDVEASLTVKIEARGNFRRQRKICNFPPFWINFKKSEVEGTPFADLDKVKVVAHCFDGWKDYERYMYVEYLAYKTYNLLTEWSFRTRLAKIEYVDTEGSNDSSTFGAFFIEHVDSLEERWGARQVKDRWISPSRYDHEVLCIAEMFQFLLGNTDFSYFASEDECCHNAKAFEVVSKSDGWVPVPYDFDMSGLVNAPYAEVGPNIPVKSVRERLYRGIGVDHKVMEDTIKLYLRKKPEIYALWENTTIVDEKTRARSLKYIDGFYKVFRSQKKIAAQVTGKLRHPNTIEKLIAAGREKQAAQEAEQ